MEKSKLNSILKRIVTASVLVPLTVGALFAGLPFVQMITLLFGSMLAWEWASMVPNNKKMFYCSIYTLNLAVAVLFSSVYAVAFVFASLVVVWFKSKGEAERKLLLLGIPYISIGVGSLVWLYVLVGPLTTLWFVVAVWCVDIGGYVVGSNLKGPKLAPKISPNKTWSGLIGGVMLSVLASFIFCYFVQILDYSAFYAVLAVFVAVISQMGDLVESSIKRHLSLKDSSNLIPGHGGVFDRIDGLIFAAPVAFIFFLVSFILSYKGN